MPFKRSKYRQGCEYIDKPCKGINLAEIIDSGWYCEVNKSNGSSIGYRMSSKIFWHDTCKGNWVYFNEWKKPSVIR